MDSICSLINRTNLEYRNVYHFAGIVGPHGIYQKETSYIKRNDEKTQNSNRHQDVFELPMRLALLLTHNHSLVSVTLQGSLSDWRRRTMRPTSKGQQQQR